MIIYQVIVEKDGIVTGVYSSSLIYEHAVRDLEEARRILHETRPTAINLAWGLEKIMQTASKGNGIMQNCYITIGNLRNQYVTQTSFQKNYRKTKIFCKSQLVLEVKYTMTYNHG